MEPVQISPQASSDIAKLTQGVDRTQVALEALKGANLNGKQIEQLKDLLKRVGPPVDAASATIVQAGDRLETIDGHNAVVGQRSVKGQQLDTLLTEGSFLKTQSDQIAYAEKLGYRLATREEHLAYVNSLLGKESDGSINAAESNALETYRKKYVRDIQGVIDLYGRRVSTSESFWNDFDHPKLGAFFVRSTSESK
jgi:hypothetical protein